MKFYFLEGQLLFNYSFASLFFAYIDAYFVHAYDASASFIQAMDIDQVGIPSV